MVFSRLVAVRIFTHHNIFKRDLEAPSIASQILDEWDRVLVRIRTLKRFQVILDFVENRSRKSDRIDHAFRVIGVSGLPERDCAPGEFAKADESRELAAPNSLQRESCLMQDAVTKALPKCFGPFHVNEGRKYFQKLHIELIA